jgi:hypothetical protein
VLVEAEVEQSAQVEAGQAMVEPQVVVGDAAVTTLRLPPRTSQAMDRSTIGRYWR